MRYWRNCTFLFPVSAFTVSTQEQADYIVVKVESPLKLGQFRY